MGLLNLDIFNKKDKIIRENTAEIEKLNTAIALLQSKNKQVRSFYKAANAYDKAGKPSGKYPFGNYQNGAIAVKDFPKGSLAQRGNIVSIPKDRRERLPNPDLILLKLKKTLVDLNELLFDTHTWSVVQSRKAGVLSLEWELQGNQNSEVLLFLKKHLDNMDINSIISEMLDAPQFGFKPMEIMWVHQNGKIIPIDIVGKPSEWFFYDYNNLLRINDKDDSKGRPTPARKFLVARHNATYTNPYGVALLSKCWWPVFFKKDDLKFWAIFTEKYGMPLLKGTVGSQGNVDELLTKLDDLRQDGIVVTDESSETTIEAVDIKSGSSSSVNNYKTFAVYQNAEISKTFLSETLTTEQSETGSFAMAQTHLTVKKEVVDADRKMIEQQFNTLIKWIIELNFGKDIELPKFVMFHEEDVDKPLAEVTEILSRTGIKYTDKYYIDRFGYKKDEFDIVQPSLFAEEVEGIVETEVDKLSKATDKVINTIDNEVKKAKTYNIARKIITDLTTELDSLEQEGVIAKGIVAGNASGQLSEGITLNEGIDE